MDLRHWKLETDSDNLAWLTFDRAGATTNTFSSEALRELGQVVDHLRAQHAEHLGGAGDAVARHDLVGDAGAADPVVALDAQRRQPVARQIGGGDQPVMAGADDDGVVA